MHIKQAEARDCNVVAAWAVELADAIRVSTEQATGLTGAAPSALVTIVAEPGLSIDDLRQVLTLTHPGAVRLVDRLVDRGWIRREPGVGRTVRLVPTRAGRSAERRLADSRRATAAEQLSALGEGELRTLAGILGPVLERAGGDALKVRRVCRLCDRATCAPCPLETGSTAG